MSGRGDDEPAVSLFSFQDIITSITGIMFLVVLLLMLMIFDSRQGNEKRSDSADVSKIRSEITALREQLSTLAATDDEFEKRIAEMAAVDVVALERQIDSVMKAIKSEGERAASAHILASALAKKLTAAEELLANTAEILKGMENESASEKTLEDLKRKRAALERLVAVRAKTVRYTIDRSSAKSPVLAECGRNGIRVLRPADGGTFDFTADTFAASALKFVEWAANNGVDKRSEYIVIMVKPSVFSECESLRELLRTKNFDRGVEIMPSDDATIFHDAENPRKEASGHGSQK